MLTNEKVELVQSRIESCLCGRRFIPPHCPACGSGMVYGLSSKSYVIDETVIKRYHCRRCTLTFDDLDRAQCEAPPRQKTKKEREAEQSLASAFTPGMTVDERKAKAFELLSKMKSTLPPRGEQE